MSHRREALRHYFLEVVRDLVTRGVIRRQEGQTLEGIVRAELPRIAEEVKSDFALVGVEIVVGFGRGVEVIAQKQVERLVDAAKSALAGMFARKP